MSNIALDAAFFSALLSLERRDGKEESRMASVFALVSPSLFCSIHNRLYAKFNELAFFFDRKRRKKRVFFNHPNGEKFVFFIFFW